MTEYSSLLSPEDLCIEIISLHIHLDLLSSLDDLPAGLGKLFSSISFPQLQSSDIKTISKEISLLEKQKEKDGYIDVLNEHHYDPPFDCDYLLLIYNNIEKLDQNQTIFLTVTVLIIYIGWCIRYKELQKLDELNTIFQVFIALANKLHNTNINNCNNFAKNIYFLVISAAHNSLLTYLTKPDIKANDITQNLQNFYSLFIKYPQNSFDAIEIALNFVIHSPNIDPQDIKELYAYIGIVCEEKKSFFPPQIAQKLADDLTLSFSQLDLPSLTLYVHLSKLLTTDSNCQIFNLFGNSIWQIILKQKDPFIKLKTDDKKEFNSKEKQKQSDNDNDDPNSISSCEVSYRFFNEERFVNGVNLKTNFIFPDPISIDKFLPEDLKIGLDLISSIASDQPDLIYILFDTLSVIIQSISIHSEKTDEKENEEKHRWDINIVFLYFCMHFYKHVRRSECEILLSPPFFNPNETVFESNGDEFTFISSVRSFVIITLLNSTNGLIKIVLSYWMNEPLLFAEIIHRFIANVISYNKNHVSTDKIDQLNFKSFCRSLMISSHHFQNLHYQVNDEKMIESIEIARTSILLLISTLFTFPPEIVNMLWSNDYFVPFFLSFLFEVPLLSFILSSLLSYLSKQQLNEEENIVLLNNLQQIMHICLPSFPNEKFVILVNDIISTLNEAFLHQRKITKYFKSFCSMFFDSFKSIVRTEPMQNYILQCIQFFSIVATENELRTAQYTALDESITKAFGAEIPQQLFNKLIQLIAGDSLASLSPTFIIQNPKAVQLFVHVSINDKKLVEIIDFIKSLVTLSFINANLLRKSDFDIYLIDIIRNLKEKEIIESVLNLFHQIAITVSSTSVVHKYISLLSPFEGKYYSEFHEKYISTLNSIVVTSMKYPVGALKMNNHEGSVEIIGLNQNEFVNGFTFVCWVQLDAFQDAKYNPNLIHIQDSKGNLISIFISSFNLYCLQATTKFKSTGKAELPIPKGRWSFISLTFTFNSENSFMTPYFGTKEMKSLEYISMAFQPGPMKCRIAGITNDSLEPTQFEARMSSFGLFPPLDIDSLDAIYQIGPRGNDYFPVNPICFYSPECDSHGFLTLRARHSNSAKQSAYLINEQSSISLSSSFGGSSALLLMINDANEGPLLEPNSSNASSMSQFDLTNIHFQFVKNKNNEQIDCDPTFTQLLMQFCKIDILLPLFDQFSMTMKNGNSFPNRKLTIDLFRNLLSSSFQVQKSFYESNGIKIISNLLYSNSSNNEEIIDYAMYLQFFSMTQSITYDPLIEEIIKVILLDVELWMRADADNHLRIIRHWDRTLFPSLLSYVSDMFQHILYIMRVYYWYEYVIEEQECIKCKRRTRNEKLNVGECRQLLGSIAALLATQRFTKSDFNCIISHCLSCVEQEQVVDLLMLIRSIGLTDPSPLSNLPKHSSSSSFSNGDGDMTSYDQKNDGSEFVSFLYSLLPRRNYLLFSLIFEVTILFYKCQLIQTPCLQDQIMLLMDQLSPSKITPDLFFRGIESIKNGFYEMFTVCCWMAINESVTEDNVLLMLDQIVPSPNFVTHQTWTFWPIVLCYLANSFMVPHRILAFIVSCDPKVWAHDYAMIHDVGVILNRKIEPIKSLFLHSIAKFIEDKPDINIDYVSSFFYMAKKYLLFKKKDEVNERLQYLYKNESPFVEETNEKNTLNFYQLNTEDDQNYQNLSNQESSFYGSLNNSYLDNSYLGDDNNQFNNYNGEEDDNAGECIMVDDDDYCKSNYYCEIKRNNNFIKSLSPKTHRRTTLARTPSSFGFPTVAIEAGSKEFSKSRNKSNDDNDRNEKENSYMDLSLNMKININLRLKPIISKITLRNELDLFGIKFDEQGNWSDHELAEITIGIFSKFPLKSFLDFDLILASFLLHWIPNVVIDHIKKLSNAIEKGNLSQSFQSSIDLFIHHCHLMNITMDPPLLKPSSNYLKNSFQLLEKLSCSIPIDDNLLTIAKHLLIVIKDEFSDLSIQKVAQNLCTQNLDDLINANRNQLLTTIEKEKITKIQNKHYWSRLWRSLEIDPAPWSVNLNYKTYFKRDNTACSFGCPFKLKRNWDLRKKEEEEEERGETGEKEKDKQIELKNVDLSEKLIEISIDSDASNDSKKPLFNIQCIIVKPTKEKAALFSLFKNRIEINSLFERHLIVIPLNEIRKLFFRNYNMKPTAIELFTRMKKSYFINFPGHKSMPILKSIKQVGCQNAKFVQTVDFNVFINQVGLKVLWQHNKISNFKYLLHLNTVSGRSFNDLSQYPIFPWILCDMILKFSTSEDASKSKKNFFDVENLKKLIDEFKQKKDAFSSFSSLSSINSFKICDYLMRVEPFSSTFINLKKDDFDCLFNSIGDSFSISTTLGNDFCVLPPEFFYDFEFLKNSNTFSEFEDVVLPKWANNDHFYFIYMMRKALESDIVSQNLNQWIDLVWGSMQSKSDTQASFKVFAPKQNFDDFDHSKTDIDTNIQLDQKPYIKQSRTFSKPSSLNLLRIISHSKPSSLLSKNSGFIDDDILSQDADKDILIDDLPSQEEKNVEVFRTSIFGFKNKDLQKINSSSVFNINTKATSNKGNFPCQLFLKPHPRKNVNEDASKQIKSEFSIPPSKVNSVSLATLEMVSDNHFKVVEIGDDGLMVTYMFSFEQKQQRHNQRMIFRSQPSLSDLATSLNNNSNGNTDEKEDIVLHLTVKEINAFKDLGVNIFARNNSASLIGRSKIAVVSHKRNKLYLIDLDKGTIEEALSNVTGIAAYKDFFAVSINDVLLTIYKGGTFSSSNHLFSLPSFGDTVKCSCINKRFLVAIVGTRGGKLIINSLSKGNIVNTIDLNGAQPFLVTVTKSWGFIVCYSQKVKNGALKHYLMVFSINGDLIRKVKIDFEIAIWTSWTSNKSFDYMAVADKNGKIFAFEVFFCDLGEKIYRCRSQIVTMNYIQDMCCVAAVTKDGRILFVPYRIQS